MSSTTKLLEMEQVLESSGWLGRSGEISNYARCLLPLLERLNWQGQIDQICQSLPHYPDQIDQVDFINTMVNLNFNVTTGDIHPKNFDSRLGPSLFVTTNFNRRDDGVFILNKGEGGQVEVYDATTEKQCSLKFFSSSKGRLFVFTPLSQGIQNNDILTAGAEQGAFKWWRNITRRFDRVFVNIAVVSVVINILALVSSLFVMFVYDKVIGSRSLDILHLTVLGAFLAITMETLLRYMRNRSMVFFGVRLDVILSREIFKKILLMPPSVIERSAISAHVARIRDFDSVRDLFTGPVGIQIIELPFTFIFIIMIAIIGGSLALVPLTLALIYVLFGLVMQHKLAIHTENGAKAGAQKQALLVETMTKIRAIKVHGLNNQWLDKFHHLSGISALSNFYSTLYTSIIEAIAYGLSMIAGVATLSVGIWLVWNNSMTTGALIASMILTWRVLHPFQAVCNSLASIRHNFKSVGQVYSLMKTAPEKSTVSSEAILQLRGDITFAGVALRYSSRVGPVISGLSLDIKQGDIVAITGPTGSGRSSLLKLVNGLYSPQIGAIRIDGIDIRQMDPVMLRKNIAYTPQKAELFHGSIKQNLLMAKPQATKQQIQKVLTLSDALEGVEALPEGLEEFVGDYRSEQLPSSLIFQLNLSRAYLRDSSIMLFDEFPPNLLNGQTGKLFRKYLEEKRGHKTIFFVSDRQEDMMAADILIHIVGDSRVFAGKPEELLQALEGNSD
jgi:ATP-binding cassette subfamily C protein/ATP-binding cassette subfamily C protein LapB